MKHYILKNDLSHAVKIGCKVIISHCVVIDTSVIIHEFFSLLGCLL